MSTRTNYIKVHLNINVSERVSEHVNEQVGRVLSAPHTQDPCSGDVVAAVGRAGQAFGAEAPA